MNYLEQKIPLRIMDRRPGDCSEVYAATEKAEKELGWKWVSSHNDLSFTLHFLCAALVGKNLLQVYLAVKTICSRNTFMRIPSLYFVILQHSW